MSLQPEEIWIVVVTHHPPPDLAPCLKDWSSEVGGVVVIDNASSPQDIQALSGLSQITLLRNERNLGLAAAQNQGIRWALQRGAKWILLLDQDSRLASSFWEAMKTYYQGLSINDREKLLLLGAHIYEAQARYFYRYVCPRGPLFSRVPCRPPGLSGLLFTISSGSLVPAERFKELGGFYEEFFIDYVDTEFCLRGFSKGYRLHVVCSAVLKHRLGKREIKKLSFLTFKPTHHPSWRKFYLYRNRLWVIRRYGPKIPSFLAFEMCAMIYDGLRVSLFERERRAKWRAIFQGIKAGLLSPNPLDRNPPDVWGDWGCSKGRGPKDAPI